jgi:hypothetical protein
MTVEIFSAMYARLCKPYDLKHQRIICASVLGFSGFLRSAELLNIVVSDLVFYPSFLALFVVTSRRINTGMVLGYDIDS